MKQTMLDLLGKLRRGGSERETEARMPVILISFNRGSMLRKVIEGYRRQTVPVDIYIHDNGSTDPATVAVLKELEDEGITVFRRPAISSPDELNLVDETVQEAFKGRRPSHYAVSDCDVSIAESSPETLATYLAVLDRIPGVKCVGPMLRIDDVPTTYPLYNAVMNRHIGRFWSVEPRFLEIDDRRVGFQVAPIDTTLAVYRPGQPYTRLQRGARLYPPYAARHLDWYPEEQDQSYRLSADGSQISNWSNPARERADRAVLQQAEYRTVEAGADGVLEAVTRTVEPRLVD